jgi:hypothetical protein
VTKPAAESAPGTARRLNPSGYPGDQDGFSERMRPKATAHLGRSWPLEFETQSETPELLARINTDLCGTGALRWSETQAWDDFVRYYRAAG